jgi:16S rRNA (uracil1498-N3)-methyltransferase
MSRFFVSSDAFSAPDQVILRGTDAVHIGSVLRLQPGDTVQVFDDAGHRFLVELVVVGKKEVVGRVKTKEKAVSAESPLNIVLGVALVKGNKVDDIIRKAVELGVAAVVALATERAVVKPARDADAKKVARWGRIAQEAAKQCGRTRIPRVENSVHSVEKFCHDNRDCDVKLLFWEEETRTRLKDVPDPGSARTAAVLTGPEGGFTRAEVAVARQCGFVSVSLGPRILRAETAPLAVLALLQYRWGDL